MRSRLNESTELRRTIGWCLDRRTLNRKAHCWRNKLTCNYMKYIAKDPTHTDDNCSYGCKKSDTEYKKRHDAVSKILRQERPLKLQHAGSDFGEQLQILLGSHTINTSNYSTL